MEGNIKLPVRLKVDQSKPEEKVELPTKPVEVKKQPKAAKPPKEAKEPNPPAQKQEKLNNTLPEPTDPNYMFKHGFLDAVFREKPSDVITRFPPEPNGC